MKQWRMDKVHEFRQNNILDLMDEIPQKEMEG